MATFAKSSFDSAIYATFRPTYPRSLFDFIFRYHERNNGARWNRAVDLGCGTGQATVELTPFKRVTGVDPSSKMIEVAQGTLKNTPTSTGQYEYIQASAENLTFLEDSSVDLVISAQACHWFDWKKIWPEVARVLRKNGSVAFWGYSQLRLTRYPSLTPRINAYVEGTDPLNSIGSYWEQPGRSILDSHLIEVPDSNEVVPGAFSDFERVFFTGNYYPSLPSPRSVIMRKKMTWDDLLSYLYTWSALHTFRQHNPTDGENPRGDVAVRFWKDLKEGAEREDGRTVEGHDEVDIEWPMAVVMATRA
ncbi:S-adenosyl-L-methionine-dependent methyltransferase [Suillus fuscotomentosus]|uniref:S-adenosyl-L-methionine-dependent methyltransferase n=1 Tax=Suillus fuscotomentosus TaxID=1912939 RepID=A0AAD4DUQ7_9AGAM|nr:S-adenosyl-L-methionine-dependent methyltransferase [Suillus fuscotomentosus]KAG1894320.1 S-adenosyl-L-methionine-dependent methyltransferase [Suillus fuscotomentosus]